MSTDIQTCDLMEIERLYKSRKIGLENIVGLGAYKNGKWVFENEEVEWHEYGAWVFEEDTETVYTNGCLLREAIDIREDDQGGWVLWFVYTTDKYVYTDGKWVGTDIHYTAKHPGGRYGLYYC